MNPEFQRNLWLELPSHRLVAMPAVLVLVFFAAWLAGGSPSFAGAAQALIALLLIVWGSRLAAEAVLNEVIGHTWDSQRMSAITPWEMTWGKLLGSTVFMWYGTAWCVVAFMASPHGSLAMLVRLVLAGLESQALALLLSVVLIRSESVNLRFQVTVAQTLTVLVMTPVLFITLFNRSDAIHWYGVAVSFETFIILSQVVFVGWTVLGLYQVMRAELQYQTGPLTWLFFVVFCVTFVAGFDHLQDFTARAALPTPAVARLFVGFCAAVALIYVCALVEPKSVARLRRWFTLLGSGRIHHGAPLSPAWAGALLVAVVLGALTVVNIVGLTKPNAPLPLVPLALVGAILLFVVRDLAVFYYLVLVSRSGRGVLAILSWLLVAYCLAPVLVSSARLDALLPVLMPTTTASPVLAVVPVLMEVVLALMIVLQRWRAVAIEGVESKIGH